MSVGVKHTFVFDAYNIIVVSWQAGGKTRVHSTRPVGSRPATVCQEAAGALFQPKLHPKKEGQGHLEEGYSSCMTQSTSTSSSVLPAEHRAIRGGEEFEVLPRRRRRFLPADEVVADHSIARRLKPAEKQTGGTST